MRHEQLSRGQESFRRVDELTLRDRTEHGAFGPVAFDHNDLHQVLARAPSAPAEYTYGVNGNIATREGGPYGDAGFTHDWRDRLVGVEQGSTTTDIVLDPLGRMLGKIRHTPGGDLARAYFHDGDQVIVEYVQPAGSTNWQPERRHIWSTWIDQLAVEQVDMDHNGTLETTLYPITDMLGSVQLLTDDAGKIVERIEYDPDGTPHFFSADTQAPAVNRILWTGDGVTPAGPVTPEVFGIGFSEVIDAASVVGVIATLTPEGGSAVGLSVTIAPDGRSAELAGATITEGVNYALHVEGLRDTSGNALQPEDRVVSVGDDEVFEVLVDTAPPVLLAVMDAADGVYLVFDEAVQSAEMASAIELRRQGTLLEGETSRVSGSVLKWHSTSTDLGGNFHLGGQYALSVVGVEDLGGNAAEVAGMSFTHLAGDDGQVLIARQAATESVPVAASAYGVTTLFQDRTWHGELGMYSYRARWYLPESGVFGERDPVGYGDSGDLYQVLGYSPVNAVDPFGREAKNKPESHSYVEFSGEDINDSEVELQKRRIITSGRDVGFYWNHKYLNFRFGVLNQFTVEESRVLERIRAVGRSGYQRPWQINQNGVSTGASYRMIRFGVPDRRAKKRFNRLLQRIRLFQVERIIDRFNDEWPMIMKMKPFSMATRVDVEANSIFERYYVRAHREASLELLSHWEKLGIEDKGNAATILQALMSSIWALAPEKMEQRTLEDLNKWLKNIYGNGSLVKHEWPGDPIHVVIGD